ncbi:MAG TPA: nucleoside triphosphate pyrophosphatase [Isosphaeraceae bacterium]|nr:nucleoside triphosphate pyrophosphatase [Isosphaeraceae bacterium]
MPDLVLGSTSRYRRALLERLGVPFRCRAPRIDEEALKTGNLDPRSLAERLATAKAESLIVDEPDATVIGSDQLVALAGRVFGKPGGAEGAVDQLAALAGRSHDLITALAVWHEGRTILHTDVTTLHMRPLTRAEIARYVAADRPLDCAGAYKLEERGIALFERIDTADHTAIIGLPLIALTTILRALGFAIP